MLFNHDFAPAIAPDADAADGTGDGGDTSRRALPVAAAGSGGALFSKLELLVIGIGDRDPPTLLSPDGLLARLRRLLFGIASPAPFADPRLEALRSLASALRHRRLDPDAKVAAALAAGVTPEQIEHLKART